MVHVGEADLNRFPLYSEEGIRTQRSQSSVIKSNPVPGSSAKVAISSETQLGNSDSWDQYKKSVVQSIDFSKKIDPDASLPAEIARRRKQFATDFVGVKKLSIGASVRKGDELGRGAFGAVSLGFSGPTDADLIIKEGLSAEGFRDMKREQNVSDALVGAVAGKLGQENPEYGKLIGMGAVVPIIGRTEDGSIIQERAKGKDLSKAILSDIAFDASGYPNSLQGAVRQCAGIAHALVTIHDAGFVHNDIKAQNIMVLDDDSAGNPCRIIDLGLMGKAGDAFQENCSANGAPEYVDRLYAKQDCESALETARRGYHLAVETLEKARQGIGDYVGLPEDEKQGIIEMYEGALGDTKARVTELEEQIKGLLRIPEMHSSYDIYSLASVLPTMLFGREGSVFAKMYWRSSSSTSEYVQLAQGRNFNGEEYFLQKFTTMNEQMKSATQGKAYPESVLKRLAHLQAQMSSLNPAERPSAIDILEVFEDIGLANWNLGHYSIQ
jgi:serine/threonine protein kinase